MYDQVRNKLPVRFADLGLQDVKNITEPLHVYRVLTQDVGSSDREEMTAKRRLWLSRFRSRRVFATAVAVSLVAVGAILGWRVYWPFTEPPAQPANIEMKSKPALPEKPSIAILAFENFSDDPSQEYFAHGIAEDIITELSKIAGLFVIARTSSFSYKGKSITTRQIGRELGVKYVLEGSVRKANGKVRITAQLIDTETEGHVWAARYDRRYKDVFAIQDELSEKIVAALAVKLTATEIKLRAARKAIDVRAYDTFLKGLAHLHKRTPEDTAKAVQYFKQALEVDPASPRAHAAIAATYVVVRRYQWHRSLGLESEYGAETLAYEHLRTAMKVPSPLAYRVRAELRYLEGRYREALEDLDRALAIDANDPDNHALLSKVYTAVGEAAKAIKPLRRAMRLNPIFPGRYFALLGIAEFALGKFETSAMLLETAHELNPKNHINLVHLVSAYGHLGRDREAREKLRIMNDLRAKAGVERYNVFIAEKAHYSNDCDIFRLVQGLRKAGVPEGPKSEPSIDGSKCGLLAPR
ncbi:MAG: tetratricopeptide repeat protein [Gammaproteobacteria bacterium]|nr:tetratricopeptide repeat protein [Gammaproteobacteria bacterium]